MRKLILIFLLLPAICFAVICFAADKPSIDADKILTKGEQILVKEYVENKIFKEFQPTKNDYVNRYDRGTVDFNPKKGINILGREVFEASNYAWQKVTIPDGTTLHEINFMQKEPYSVSIYGKNLTFIRCNLTNVAIDPTWTVIDSATANVKRIKKLEEDYQGAYKKVTIGFLIEKDSVFKEVREYEEICYTIDDYNSLISSLNK